MSQPDATTAAWTSATADETVTSSLNVRNHGAAAVTIRVVGTLSTGNIRFDKSADDTNWFTLLCASISDTQVYTQISLLSDTTYACQAVGLAGFRFMRVRLADTITGTATVNVSAEAIASSALPYMMVQTVNNPFLVSAVDLDIRNLAQTQDAVTVYGSDDGGTTKRAIKTDSGGAVQVDLESALPAGNNNIGDVDIPAGQPAQGNWGHGAIGAAPPAGGTQIMGPGSGATGGQSQAVPVCTEFANIDQTSGEQIITGVSGRRIYICSLNLVTASAQNIAVVAGTGTVCATSTVAVPGTSGGSTAATGWNLAANGGIVIGTGFGAIGKTTVNADNLCILQSGSGQISGGIAYAIY